MSKQAIVEVLKRIMKKAIVENAPAPSKPEEKPGPGTKEEPGPAVAPGRPSTDKPKPRRPFEPKPGVKTTPIKNRATMKEAEMLDKIVKRYRTAKKNG